MKGSKLNARILQRTEKSNWKLVRLEKGFKISCVSWSFEKSKKDNFEVRKHKLILTQISSSLMIFWTSKSSIFIKLSFKFKLNRRIAELSQVLSFKFKPFNVSEKFPTLFLSQKQNLIKKFFTRSVRLDSVVKSGLHSPQQTWFIKFVPSQTLLFTSLLVVLSFDSIEA